MNERVRTLKDLLWIVALVGVLAISLRLWFGLGPTTHLNDAVPWGLWKILNMVAGVALATGGFTVGLLVYVLGMERLRPLVKPAILIAFLGYASSVFALLLDIGLPHRIWHPFLMWNTRSFLFEVALCVASYLTITVVELTPVILERFPRLKAVEETLHRAAPGVVIVGITLSSLHHTSLGSLFLVTPQRLHALWYTGWLPVLFITSAMGAGMMVTVLVTLAWRKLYAYGEDVDASDEDQAITPRDLSPALRRLASVAAGVLAVFLVLKLVDLFRTGAWTALTAWTWESWFYVGELALTSVIPIVLMLIPRVRRSTAGLAWAAGSAALGMVLNRLNVGIFGYFRDAGTVYFPSLLEWALSFGVIAIAGLALLFIAEKFPIFSDAPPELAAPRRPFRPVFDSLSGVWRAALGDRLGRVSLLSVAVLPVAWLLFYPPFHGPADRLAEPVQPPFAADVERAVLVIDGNRRDMAVTFPHQDHRDRLGGKESCARCHHLSMPWDKTSRCSRCHRAMHAPTDLFDHGEHIHAVAREERLTGLVPGNRSCTKCHRPGRPESAVDVKPCTECHEEDMSPSPHFEDVDDMQLAPAYRAAFHEHCIDCHRREAAERGRPELGECRNCHPSPTGGDPHRSPKFVASLLE